ncbi:hypothetical protein ALMP_57100 [Streptomyces sp. A012304]|nr:hypothetical protein ALMP_57100 [Streptomyces sp. A012304]
MRALAAALPDVVADGTGLDARARAQYGAWLCGACLGVTTMSLHHKLCHALGGTLDRPHAPTHTVVLPHVLDYRAPWTNQDAAPKAPAALGRALGTPADPATYLWDLTGRLGAPRGGPGAERHHDRLRDGDARRTSPGDRRLASTARGRDGVIPEGTHRCHAAEWRPWKPGGRGQSWYGPKRRVPENGG